MISPGAVIADRYVVEELVGEGGLAQVWRVRHKELGSVHALKILLFRKPRLMDRLILEGRIQAQLRHPNIVAVTDVLRHAGQVGLLMEYVDGVPLQAWMDANPSIDLDQALELFAPILAGVRVAHEAGVLHRDLKPSNILLARAGRGMIPKVTDFGIAKVIEGGLDGMDTRSGAVMGTPGYLAPEQAMDASRVDRRADIFALGAILYEMISGRRAFDAAEVYIEPGTTPEPLTIIRPDVPEGVAAAVHRAMALDATERFPDILSFARALFEGRPDLAAVAEGTRHNVEPLTFGLGPRAAFEPRPTLIAQGTVAEQAAPPRVQPAVVRPTRPLRRPQPEAEPPSVPEATEESLAVSLEAPPTDAWTGPSPASQWTQPIRAKLEPRPPAEPPKRRPMWLFPVGALAGAAVVALIVSRLVDAAPEPSVPAGPPPPPSGVTANALPGSGAGWRSGPGAPETPPAPEAPAPRPALSTPPGTAPAQVVPPPAQVIPAPPLSTTVLTPPAPQVPDLNGSWRGYANGLPLTLRLQNRPDGAVAGEVKLAIGPTESEYRIKGTTLPDGTVSLSSVEGDIMMVGHIEGGRLKGTYQYRGTAMSMSWSATRR